MLVLFSWFTSKTLRLIKNPVLLLATVFALQSCQEDPENILKSRRELLTQHRWRVTRVLVNNAEDPAATDALVGLKASFSSSGTYSITNNGSRSGVWRFTSDEEAILFDSAQSRSDTWLILSLENSSFEASYQENNESIQLFMKPE